MDITQPVMLAIAATYLFYISGYSSKASGSRLTDRTMRFIFFCARWLAWMTLMCSFLSPMSVPWIGICACPVCFLASRTGRAFGKKRLWHEIAQVGPGMSDENLAEYFLWISPFNNKDKKTAEWLLNQRAKESAASDVQELEKDMYANIVALAENIRSGRGAAQSSPR